MRNKTILLLLLLALSFRGLSGQNTNLFNYSNSQDFANYLYHNGEYKLAKTEFKRLLFMAPDDIKSAIKIHDCFIRSGDYNTGIHYSFNLSDKLTFNDTLYVLQGKLLLLNHNDSEFINWLTQKELNPEMDLFLRMSYAMFNNNWQMANEYTMKAGTFREIKPLLPIVKKTANIQYKNPSLSGLMSAIVPGSGKAYSGFWKDGIFSLIFVGVSVWQSYNGFNRDGINSKYGWIMAGIGFSFYTGNIYGGVKAANKRNYETNHNIKHEYEDAFINTYSRF